jgi:hypothetical protein
MSKSQLLLGINILTAITFIITAITGIARIRIHSTIAVIFIILVLIHFFLNWGWVAGTFKYIFKKK